MHVTDWFPTIMGLATDHRWNSSLSRSPPLPLSGRPIDGYDMWHAITTHSHLQREREREKEREREREGNTSSLLPSQSIEQSFSSGQVNEYNHSHSYPQVLSWSPRSDILHFSNGGTRGAGLTSYQRGRYKLRMGQNENMKQAGYSRVVFTFPHDLHPERRITSCRAV
mmetsp:Transcript_2370/g.2487  ORF Transcript_2370/g.2487 Transcript_2370/m.2487 type:complete len:168 (-) Transcript_2370:47-550(-)